MDVQWVMAIVAVIAAVLSGIGVFISVASFFYNIGKDARKKNHKKEE